MVELSNLIRDHLHYVIFGLTILITLSLIVFMHLNYRLGQMNKKYTNMMRGMDGENIEAMLITHVEGVRDVVEKVELLSQKYQQLDAISKKCVQRIGLVRFNAFEDMGSELSFSVALLDSSKNGIVVSNIFGRNESRIYAKPINGGVSDYFLTDEEKVAIEKAR